jgi:hypothetical protein
MLSGVGLKFRPNQSTPVAPGLSVAYLTLPENKKLRIRDVLASNLGRDTGYPDEFRVLPPSLLPGEYLKRGHDRVLR